MQAGSQAYTPHSYLSSSDRKYNVVVFGVAECAKGTPRTSRLNEDQSKVIAVFEKVEDGEEVKPDQIK